MAKFTAQFSNGHVGTRTSPAAYTHAYMVRSEASRSRSTCHKGTIISKVGYSTSETAAAKAASGYAARAKTLGFDILLTKEVVTLSVIEDRA